MPNILVHKLILKVPISIAAIHKWANSQDVASYSSEGSEEPAHLQYCQSIFCVWTQSRVTYGPQREKTCLWGFANNKGADQPAHPHSLISAFVIHLLKSIISRLATSEISLFYLVSVAEETCLSLALSETPKTGFLTSSPIHDGSGQSLTR